MVCSCQQPPSPWDWRDGPVPHLPAPCPWSWPWVLVLPASPPSTASWHGAKQDCHVCAHTLFTRHCCCAHSHSSAWSISRWAWYLGKMCVFVACVCVVCLTSGSTLSIRWNNKLSLFAYLKAIWLHLSLFDPWAQTPGDLISSRYLPEDLIMIELDLLKRDSIFYLKQYLRPFSPAA